MKRYTLELFEVVVNTGYESDELHYATSLIFQTKKEAEDYIKEKIIQKCFEPLYFFKVNGGFENGYVSIITQKFAEYAEEVTTYDIYERTVNMREREEGDE